MRTIHIDELEVKDTGLQPSSVAGLHRGQLIYHDYAKNQFYYANYDDADYGRSYELAKQVIRRLYLGLSVPETEEENVRE